MSDTERTTHTPGPWKVRRRDGAPHGDSDNLGWDWDWDHPDANVPPEPMRGLFSKEADARLVAAAPDLLAALKAIVCPEHAHYEALAQAKAAIAKAEGAST